MFVIVSTVQLCCQKLLWKHDTSAIRFYVWTVSCKYFKCSQICWQFQLYHASCKMPVFVATAICLPPSDGSLINLMVTIIDCFFFYPALVSQIANVPPLYFLETANLESRSAEIYRCTKWLTKYIQSLIVMTLLKAATLNEG